mmetsp:Transcript_31854/g.48838  ORF Transcript_31854/g.48838 Transcript_31854/m.48838 type:complete len:134 (+) Transcript_31854:435-836(+)
MQKEVEIRQRLLDKSLSRSRSNDKTSASASKRMVNFARPPQAEVKLSNVASKTEDELPPPNLPIAPPSPSVHEDQPYASFKAEPEQPLLAANPTLQQSNEVKVLAQNLNPGSTNSEARTPLQNVEFEKKLSSV